GRHPAASRRERFAPRGGWEQLSCHAPRDQRGRDQAGKLEREYPVGERLGRVAEQQPDAGYRRHRGADPHHGKEHREAIQPRSRRDAEHAQRDGYPAADQESHAESVEDEEDEIGVEIFPHESGKLRSLDPAQSVHRSPVGAISTAPLDDRVSGSGYCSGYQKRAWQLSHTPSIWVTRSLAAAASPSRAACASFSECAAKAAAICPNRRGSLSRCRWTSAIDTSPSPTSALSGAAAT